MLRTQSPVRALTVADHDEALAMCARDPAANVFVAARIEEGALRTNPGALLGFRSDGRLRSLCWVAANVVPVECDEETADAFAHRIRRWHKGCASLFGPSAQVLALWSVLEHSWGKARAVRAQQPLMVTSTTSEQIGFDADPRVRFARLEEVDIILPAAAAMFTDEIGYPPFSGSSRGYRILIEALVRKGHTFLWRVGDEVLFKADVGSVALGAAQIQGVWLAPRLRGQGRSVSLMAAASELVMDTVAPQATLYVNDFNHPARAVYRTLGFTEVGTFTTVLL